MISCLLIILYVFLSYTLAYHNLAQTLIKYISDNYRQPSQKTIYETQSVNTLKSRTSGISFSLCRIVKGDARGTFDRFCYAFSMIRGTEDICNKVIQRVNQTEPQWKMNVKQDNDRFKYMQQGVQNPRQGQMSNYPPQTQGRMPFDQKQSQYPSYQRAPYQPVQNQYPDQRQQFGGQGFYGNMNPQMGHQMGYQQQHVNNVNTNQPEKIVGEKQQRILVREIWLGGIPEMCDKVYMHQLMSEFGMIENLQIFPKFAFIKFRLAQQATLAFQRADRISVMFGNPPGFRIFFSDPSRRANIVGNHYQYDRQSPFIPVLFLGFPPVTSATINLQHMKSIVDKYGSLLNFYMRKNSNNQTRSYFLFSFDNLKSALRAKTQLNKRRDLLGDKRVEVTLLLDQAIVLRGKDLTHTERSFQTQANMDRRKQTSEKPYSSNYTNYQPKQVGLGLPNVPGQMSGYTPMYQPQPMHYPNYMHGQQPQLIPSQMIPSQYPPSDLYFMPPYYDSKSTIVQNQSSNVHELLQSVLQKTSSQRLSTQRLSSQRMPQRAKQIQIKPIKTYLNENVSEIVNKMLAGTKDQIKEKQVQREVSWSGFLTWKGMKRVGVDGFTLLKEPEDYVINITNLVQAKDLVIKDKATMVLWPQSEMYQAMFKQYIKALGTKVGVSSTPRFLIYVMAKSKQSDEIQQIHSNQLLVIMQKSSLISLVREKLQKCQELK